MARLTPAALTRPHERQHPGAADRGGPEPEAVARGERLGPTPRPVRELDGPAKRAVEALGRLRMTISVTGTRVKLARRIRGRTYEQPRARPFSTPWSVIAPIDTQAVCPMIGPPQRR